MLHDICYFHAKLIKIAACSSIKFQTVFKYKKGSPTPCQDFEDKLPTRGQFMQRPQYAISMPAKLLDSIKSIFGHRLQAIILGHVRL